MKETRGSVQLPTNTVKNSLMEKYLSKDEPPQVDIIGGFPYSHPYCKGCGAPLKVENAALTDGCPCNTPLGINSMNETRWRLLLELVRKLQMEINPPVPLPETEYFYNKAMEQSDAIKKGKEY